VPGIGLVLRGGLGRALLLTSTVTGSLPAQRPPDVARERAEYAAWLTGAPTSPLAAIAQQPIGAGLRLGPPDADVPLEGIAEHRVVERGGTVRLESAAGPRVMPRGVPIRLGDFALTADGPRSRAALTVFGPRRSARAPVYYEIQPSLVFVGPLAPPERPATERVLGVDGIEVEAAEAGSVVVPVAGERVRLRVLRLPSGDGEESELEIFFRDGTNGRETYPAGRFVSLVPEPDGRYRLDFNRARNPFCAYSSAYPCPAPWRGNVFTGKIAAGERYQPDGVAAPPVARDSR
jgi:uncharacterized protein